jgi:hypothetical protein
MTEKAAPASKHKLGMERLLLSSRMAGWAPATPTGLG